MTMRLPEDGPTVGYPCSLGVQVPNLGTQPVPEHLNDALLDGLDLYQARCLCNSTKDSRVGCRLLQDLECHRRSIDCRELDIYPDVHFLRLLGGVDNHHAALLQTFDNVDRVDKSLVENDDEVRLVYLGLPVDPLLVTPCEREHGCATPLGSEKRECGGVAA